MRHTLSTGCVCVVAALQELREAIAKLYDTLTPEQVVVCVPEEGESSWLRDAQALTDWLLCVPPDRGRPACNSVHNRVMHPFR